MDRRARAAAESVSVSGNHRVNPGRATRSSGSSARGRTTRLVAPTGWPVGQGPAHTGTRQPEGRLERPSGQTFTIDPLRLPHLVEQQYRSRVGHRRYPTPTLGSMAITTGVITCPDCGTRARAIMPEDACQHFYRCTGCGQVLSPRDGDCCVFCSYSEVVCPPRQTSKAEL